MQSLEPEETPIYKEAECLKKVQFQMEGNEIFNGLEEFLDERFLLHFVRGKGYDAIKAYETLVQFMDQRRTKYRVFFKSLLASDVGMNNAVIKILKQRDHLGRLIILARSRMWDPRKISMENSFKVWALFFEEIWNSKDAEIHGVVTIFDMAKWNFSQMRATYPNDILKLYNMVGKNFPLKYKSIHFVNEIYVFSLVLRILKPLLPQKIGDRIHVHSSNLESLHANISPDILPKSLGGSVPDEKAFDENIEQRIREKDDYYRLFTEKL